MRKPTHPRWFVDVHMGVVSRKTGNTIMGSTKFIREYGNFLLKAADWLDEQESWKKKRGS